MSRGVANPRGQHRARCHAQNTLRDTAEQQSLDPRAPKGSHHDEIDIEIPRDFCDGFDGMMHGEMLVDLDSVVLHATPPIMKTTQRGIPGLLVEAIRVGFGIGRKTSDVEPVAMQQVDAGPEAKRKIDRHLERSLGTWREIDGNQDRADSNQKYRPRDFGSRTSVDRSGRLLRAEQRCATSTCPPRPRPPSLQTAPNHLFQQISSEGLDPTADWRILR